MADVCITYGYTYYSSNSYSVCEIRELLWTLRNQADLSCLLRLMNELSARRVFCLLNRKTQRELASYFICTMWLGASNNIWKDKDAGGPLASDWVQDYLLVQSTSFTKIFLQSRAWPRHSENTGKIVAGSIQEVGNCRKYYGLWWPSDVFRGSQDFVLYAALCDIAAQRYIHLKHKDNFNSKAEEMRLKNHTFR